jgi:glutamine synthetase
MARLVEFSDYCREIHTALAAQDLTVLQVHPEYAPGQFEVSLAPADAVTAADAAVLTRETIRAVSVRHGLRASFAPVVMAGTVGNGGHLHMSLHREGIPLFSGGDGRYGVTGPGESFLAGVLAELPALMAIGAPSVASYLRQVPSHWAGVYQCWGRENREAALRLVTGSAGQPGGPANFEVKCMDLSANPYLLVGAVLAAGLATLDKALKLPDEVTGDPAGSDLPRLPQTLTDSLAALEASTVLREALGSALYDSFVDVRQAEQALFADAQPEHIVVASRWRY